jgi:NADH-quinone oxidoreductase subunit A
VSEWLPIVLLAALTALFATASLGVSALLRPRRPTPAKLMPYECGIVPEHEPPERFPVKFYLVAMLFIIFDIEIIFLFPFAVVFRDLGLFGLGAVAIFLGLLAVAYAYEWMKGALDWG